jgi:hypothetical protein
MHQREGRKMEIVLVIEMNMASGLTWSNRELVQLRIFVYAPCTCHGFLWENSLLKKGTSGLGDETQKRFENSIVFYVKMNGVAIVWVVHNEDIAERLLAP